MTGLRSYLILLFWILGSCKPARFEAQAWDPPKNPGLLQTLPPNQQLTTVQIIGAGEWHGPEDIAIDKTGSIYSGSTSGRIQRLGEDGHALTFAELPGQILGMDFDSLGNLYVCVDRSGLWRIDPNGKGELLVSGYQGREFGLLDDVKVGSDGFVYFSEASEKYNMSNYVLDLIEGIATGHLFRYDPLQKTTEVLVDELGFANGVSVAPDASYVLVNETSRYRIRKYWLQGSSAGKNEMFMENLPGFPDGLSNPVNGRIWIAFVSVRNPLLDILHPRPLLKNLLAGLPKSIQPKEKPYGLIASVNENGQWLQGLHDPEGKIVPGITSVEEKDGQLWLGSLHGHALYTIASPSEISLK